MAIYVDQLIEWPKQPGSKWRFGKSCHMFGFPEKALHTLATSIGLKPAWFQRHRFLGHYDLTENKRRQAISCGANPVEGPALKLAIEDTRARVPKKSTAQNAEATELLIVNQTA